MMWFDDGDAADGYTGKKQIGSLSGGQPLLRGAPTVSAASRRRVHAG